MKSVKSLIKKLLLLLTISTMPFLQSNLLAKGSVKLVGGTNLAFYSDDPESTEYVFGLDFRYDFGLLVGVPLNDLIELEVGAIYHQYRLKATYTSGFFDGYVVYIDYQSVQFPLLFRLNLGPVSLGAGGFYEINIGEVTATDEYNGTTSTATYSYDEVYMSTSNYGYMVAVGFRKKVSESFDIITDFRYRIALGNVSTADGLTRTVKSFELLLMASFKI